MILFDTFFKSKQISVKEINNSAIILKIDIDDIFNYILLKIDKNNNQHINIIKDKNINLNNNNYNNNNYNNNNYNNNNYNNNYNNNNYNNN